MIWHREYVILHKGAEWGYSDMLGSIFAVVAVICAGLASQMEPDRQCILLVATCIAMLIAAWHKARPSLLLLSILSFTYVLVGLPGGLSRIFPDWYLTPGHLHPDSRQWLFITMPILCAFFYWICCRRQSGGLPLALIETSEDGARLLMLTGIGAVLALFGLASVVLTDLVAPYLSGQLPFEEIATGGTTGSRVSVWQTLVFQSHLAALFPVAFVGLSHTLGGKIRLLGLFHTISPKLIGLVLLTVGIAIASGLTWLLAHYGWEEIRNMYLAQAWRSSTHLVLDFADKPELARLVVVFQDPWLTRSLKLLFAFAGLCAISAMLRALVLLTGPIYLERRASCSIGRYGKGKKSFASSMGHAK